MTDAVTATTAPPDAPSVWPPHALAVTGVGSWPEEPGAGAQRAVFDALANPADPLVGIPHLVEQPLRGPGADMIGRAASLLVDMPVDLQPSGWRLVGPAGAAGRDQRRAASYLRGDLDTLAEVADGYTGLLKTQATGPWTLGASMWLPRGQRIIGDHGATADLIASLAEGISQHVQAVAASVPGAHIIVQVDEPGLTAVATGRVRTVSKLGTLPAIAGPLITEGLRTMTRAARDAGAVGVVLHTCAVDLPWKLIPTTGDGRVDAVATDAALLTPADYDALGAAIDNGVTWWAGITPPESGQVASTVRSVTATLTDLGLVSGIAGGSVALTPSCGLAGMSPDAARRTYSGLVDVARALLDTTQ